MIWNAFIKTRSYATYVITIMCAPDLNCSGAPPKRSYYFSLWLFLKFSRKFILKTRGINLQFSDEHMVLGQLQLNTNFDIKFTKLQRS